MKSLSKQLIELINDKPINADDLIKTREFMLDWAGCYAAGSKTEQGSIIKKWHDKWGGTGLEQEVFLTAALSHITETDDLHRRSVTHPACVVFPVTWHLSRYLKKSFGECLIASLKGYEAMCRVGEAVGPAHYKIFHNTATAGVFGSAVAACSLLELNEEQSVWALGNAGTQAAGLWQFNVDATMSKHLHAGHAASSGLKAALLAAEGFTGPSSILEGEKGFFKAFCSDADPDAVVKKSDSWKLIETSVKSYPSCRHTHPAIDAALDIRTKMSQNGQSVDEIDSIEISTYETALRFTDNISPSGTFSAKFSIQYCVIVALSEGFPQLYHFEGHQLETHRRSELLGISKVKASEDFTNAYPSNWGAKVVVNTGSKVFESEIKSAKGDPENPLTKEELVRKFNGLMNYADYGSDITSRFSNWILEANSDELVPELLKTINHK